MTKLPVYNQEGKEIGSMDLDTKLFDEKINTDVLYQAVNIYLANKRRGCASTKTRAKVSGGGRKPWKQKGTGRARVGSIRSPLWRGGGIIFGPHPRSFHKGLSKKMRILALKSSINAKLKDGNLIILEDIKLKEPKTKEMKKVLENFLPKADRLRQKKIKEKMLLLVDKVEPNLKFGCRNLANLFLLQAEDVNAYDILKFKRLIITKPGLEKILKRIS